MVKKVWVGGLGRMSWGMTGTEYWDLIYSARIAEYIWMEASLCLEGAGRECGGGGAGERDGSGWRIGQVGRGKRWAVGSTGEGGG